MSKRKNRLIIDSSKINYYLICRFEEEVVKLGEKYDKKRLDLHIELLSKLSLVQISQQENPEKAEIYEVLILRFFKDFNIKTENLEEEFWFSYGKLYQRFCCFDD